MSRRTKKVKSSGRFGPRYGISVKKGIRSIDQRRAARYTCPRCYKKNVKRVSSGIWECRSCSYKFSGGAYSPTTGKFRTLEGRLGRV